MTRGRRAALCALAALALLAALFDWNWLRRPLETYVSSKTQRAFRVADLQVRLGLAPSIRMRGVELADAPGSGRSAPMARIGELEFSLSLRDLFDGRLLLPRVALADAKLQLERDRDGRANWKLAGLDDAGAPSRLRVGSLTVRQGQLAYADHSVPFEVRVDAGTADAGDGPYTTTYRFEGRYYDARFSGRASTGDVLSFQHSGVPFPLRAHLDAGTTRVDVEGRLADAARPSALDLNLRIEGRTLANLYPFLLLPLPASPPYRLEGRLQLDGTTYRLDELRGRIGSTDVSGSGRYVQRAPRPLLQATLHSELLDLADLGPLIGVITQASPDRHAPTQAETGTRETARAEERRASGGRVLPAGTPPGERLLPTGAFEGGRINAIDADARLTARRVRAPDRLEVENVDAALKLRDGVLQLDPFDVDFAGGRIRADIDLDAREPLLRSRADVRLEQLDLGRMLPSAPRLARSEGRIDGQVALRGSGNSVADVAAQAEGRVSATLSSGRISNLLDAAAGLNGGKVLQLLVGGDREIPIRCGAAVFDVKGGQGRSRLFVVDTAQSRIDAGGSFDLDHERFDLQIEPQPKRAGILSLRSPVRLHGSFRDPEVDVDKTRIALRAGGALALGAVAAPLAALIPLIETGPGKDVDCARLPRLARGEAK